MTAHHTPRRVYMAAADTTDPHITSTADQTNAEVVYFLVDHDWQQTSARETIRTQHEKFETIAESVHLVEVNLGDIYAVLAEATTKAATHQDDTVVINISAGPNTAAVGLAMSAMTTSADAIATAPSTDQDASTQSSTLQSVPEYPIEPPTHDQLQVMRYIDQEDTDWKTPKVNILCKRAIDDELSFILDGHDRERRGGVDEATRYRRFNARIQDPLLEQGLISIDDRGSQHRISLTDVGELVNDAFAHKLTP